MKIILVTFLSLFLINNNYQKKECYFLNITTFNHAQKAYEGTFIYMVTDDHLVITNTKESRFRDDVLLFKKLDKKSIEKLKKINLYNLENNYFNKCILTTSGNEYFINIEDKINEKEIHLHHFYNPKIAELITELNKHIPKKLKLEYVSSATKQDCN